MGGAFGAPPLVLRYALGSSFASYLAEFQKFRCEGCVFDRNLPIAVQLSQQIGACGARLSVLTQALARLPEAFEHLADRVRTLVYQDPPKGVAPQSLIRIGCPHRHHLFI